MSQAMRRNTMVEPRLVNPALTGLYATVVDNSMRRWKNGVDPKNLDWRISKLEVLKEDSDFDS